LKIRITQAVDYKNAKLMPGEFHDLPDKDALPLIEQDMAVAWDEDDKPKRKAKAVNDGDG
jgi:hypothetical protein